MFDVNENGNVNAKGDTGVGIPSLPTLCTAHLTVMLKGISAIYPCTSGYSTLPRAYDLSVLLVRTHSTDAETSDLRNLLRNTIGVLFFAR